MPGLSPLSPFDRSTAVALTAAARTAT